MPKRDLEVLDAAVWCASMEIALAVTESESGAELGQRVMDVLHRMTGCDLSSIITAVPGYEWSAIGEIGDAADNRTLVRNYWRYSSEMSYPEIQRMAGRFTCATDIFAARRRDRLALFREFLGPRRLDQAIACAWVADDRLWGLGITRTGPAYPDRTIARLDALAPHLKAALRARSWWPGGRGLSIAEHGPAIDSGTRGKPWSLTTTQERTMELAIRGLTNKEIGGLLGVSPYTVRNSLVEVFRKVGVSRRSELAFIVRSGIADGDPCRNRAAIAAHRAIVAAVTRAQPAADSRANSDRTRPPRRDEAGT